MTGKVYALRAPPLVVLPWATWRRVLKGDDDAAP